MFAHEPVTIKSHEEVTKYWVEWTTKQGNGVDYDQTCEPANNLKTGFVCTGGSWGIISTPYK